MSKPRYEDNGRFDSNSGGNFVNDEIISRTRKKIIRHCEDNNASYFKAREVFEQSRSGSLSRALSVLEDRGLIERWGSNSTPTTWRYNG